STSIARGTAAGRWCEGRWGLLLVAGALCGAPAFAARAAVETAAGARIADGGERAVAACPPEAWGEARSEWVKAAAGHESDIVAILERARTSPRDEDARA